MKHLKPIFILFTIFITACSETIEKRGISSTKIKEININLGISKKDLVRKYGPPVFESTFNKNTIYYVSHTSTYETFDDRKTKELIVYEVVLDKNKFVKKVIKYDESDSIDIKIIDSKNLQSNTTKSFWKNIIDNMRKRNVEN